MTSPMQARTVRVAGVVQGVGFRPFIYGLAVELGLAGWVLNDPAGVEIRVQGPSDTVDRFIEAIADRAPPLSRITRVAAEPCPIEGGLDDFEIVASRHAQAIETSCPADAHVCPDCLAEMRDPAERRYRYPFINCTNCGPRYSIINRVPYDRPETSMASFVLCPVCRGQYEDPTDRRYHAQPIACPECGPRLRLVGPDGADIETDDVCREAVRRLTAGAIVAVKSLGGFHLAVNPFDAAAVHRLRKLKKRDWKPFAVMVRDVVTARRFTEIHPVEAALLEDPARPILLLKRRPGGGLASAAIARDNPNLGLMLPAAPLHYLLLEDEGMPALVMTSGNISGFPICIDDETAVQQLGTIADALILHDRDIVRPVDDSVLRVTALPDFETPIVTFLRRSRGYAPAPLTVPGLQGERVAFGAELKTTVAVARDAQVHLSQHIGDLKNEASFANHQATAHSLAKLCGVAPETVVCDMHPAFRSTRAAQTAKETAGQEVVAVQHHHAHMASCMAENGLEGEAIGVIYDGVGYGEDGGIWGGEILLGDAASVRRVGHIRPITLLGGDKAVLEPARIALALLLDAGFDPAQDPAVRELACIRHFAAEERRILARMYERGLNSPPATSMGRLFDGVAALLDLCLVSEFEAHGPVMLEGLLGRDFASAYPYPVAFETPGADAPFVVDFRPAIRAIVADLRAGRSKVEIARRFHDTVVAFSLEACRRVRAETGTVQVALSGGAFVNEYLMVNALRALRADAFRPHVQQLVPPNDGGLSLGQIVVADARAKRRAAAEPVAELDEVQ